MSDLSARVRQELENRTHTHRVIRTLLTNSIPVWIVGGAIRDLLKGKPPTDLDLVVQPESPEQLLAVLNSIPGHLDTSNSGYGVYTHWGQNEQVEMALPRKPRKENLSYDEFIIEPDCSLPLKDDLERRDFDVNAIAFNCLHKTVLDPTGGIQSLQKGQFRALGLRSWREDGVRVLRGLVLSARLNLEPDQPTFEILRGSTQNLKSLESNRIGREWERIFREDFPHLAIRLAHRLGVLKVLLPELERAWEFDQHNRHHKDLLGDHSLATLLIMCQLSNDPDLRLAALLHDIGKPVSAWLDFDNQAHYYETDLFPAHEIAGAKIALQRLPQLGYSNQETDRINLLIENHMFEEFDNRF